MAYFRLKLTSQHEFAIWQPAWPTTRVCGQYQQLSLGVPPKAVKARARVGCGVPFKLMTSLMVGLGRRGCWGI